MPHDACVSALILDTPGTWNTTLIEQIFSPGDAQLITGLVLSSRRGADKPIWSREKSGTYSVRSAYRLLCEETSATDLGCSDYGVWKRFWKKVWSIRVPHKVRQFLWRACTESLPTMVNMQRRCIVPTALCSFCHSAEEDVRHVLWSCPVLSPVWASHVLACKLFRRRHFSFVDTLSDLFVLGTTESTAEIVFMFWLLWNRRNQVMYRNEAEPLESIPALAVHLASEFLSAQITPDTSGRSQPWIKWKPSSSSAFKVNFDAALFPDQQWTGVGVVIRDGQGLPIAALCKRSKCFHSVDDAEALAALEAMQFAMEIGIQDAEFEGDALTICNALRCQDQSLASYDAIIDDVLFFARALQRCSFSHVKWEGNRVAHMLARRAIEL